MCGAGCPTRPRESPAPTGRRNLAGGEADLAPPSFVPGRNDSVLFRVGFFIYYNEQKISERGAEPVAGLGSTWVAGALSSRSPEGSPAPIN